MPQSLRTAQPNTYAPDNQILRHSLNDHVSVRGSDSFLDSGQSQGQHSATIPITTPLSIPPPSDAWRNNVILNLKKFVFVFSDRCKYRY